MRIYRNVGSFLVGAALIAPAGTVGSTNFQDDHHQDDKYRDRDDKNQKRYYDKNHKDYHNWDGRENCSYQQWTTETHRDNRDFSISKARSSQNTGIGVTPIQMTTGTGTKRPSLQTTYANSALLFVGKRICSVQTDQRTVIAIAMAATWG